MCKNMTKYNCKLAYIKALLKEKKIFYFLEEHTRVEFGSVSDVCNNTAIKDFDIELEDCADAIPQYNVEKVLFKLD